MIAIQRVALAGLVAFCFLPAATAVAQTDAAKTSAVRKRPIILSRQRTYRLDVGRIDGKILLNVERQWTFKNAFPPALLAAIRKHPKKKAAKPESGAKKPALESGYIRWTPDKKQPLQAGGLLWYANGKKRREVIIGIDAILREKPAKGRTAATIEFDGLKVAAKPATGELTAVTFAGLSLPAKSDAAAGVKVTDTMETNVTGELTRGSSREVRAANALLSEEILQKFRAAAFANFKNQSHHGITLGWLGFEHLQHNLMLLPGNDKANIAFRYRVSGTPFPVRLIRRQIGNDGWPMVLSGHEYVGATDEGRRIFRPVEFQLHRASKPKTKPGKP